MTPPISDLDQYRDDVERFLALPRLAADPTFAHLFSAEAVVGLDTDEGPNAQRRRALARFAVEGHLRGAGAEEMAELEERLRAPLVTGSPAGAVSLRDVDPLLAAEPDRARRRELHTARLRAIDSHLRDLVSDAALRRADAARALGATSAAALAAQMCGLDLSQLAADAEHMLGGSDDLAARSLDRAAQAGLGISAADLDSADLPRLTRAPHVESDLPAGAVASAVARTRELLGSRDETTWRSSIEGVSRALEMLRGTGAALARAGVSPRLPVEARRLGDPALVQAHALLLEGLLAEPEWLRRVLGAADPEPIAAMAATIRLLTARTAAAGVMGLCGGDIVALMSRALGLAWPSEMSIGAELGSLEPADELRGRMLAAALRVHLRETFGERWFLEGGAASLLRELWLEGGDLDAQTLARELGSPGLDPMSLVAEAGERLG